MGWRRLSCRHDPRAFMLSPQFLNRRKSCYSTCLSLFKKKKKEERNLAFYDHIFWFRWLILVKGVNYKLISLILKNKLDGSSNFKNLLINYSFDKVLIMFNSILLCSENYLLFSLILNRSRPIQVNLLNPWPRPWDHNNIIWNKL